MRNKIIFMADGKALANVNLHETAGLQGFLKVINNNTGENLLINKSHVVSIEDYIEADLSGMEPRIY